MITYFIIGFIVYVLAVTIYCITEVSLDVDVFITSLFGCLPVILFWPILVSVVLFFVIVHAWYYIILIVRGEE